MYFVNYVNYKTYVSYIYFKWCKNGTYANNQHFPQLLRNRLNRNESIEPNESNEWTKFIWIKERMNTWMKLVRLCGPQQCIKYTAYIKYTKTEIIYKSQTYVFGMFHLLVFRESKTCLLLFLVQVKGWDGLYRIEGTNLVCAISTKLVSDRKT